MIFTHASIVPLIGGLTLGVEKAFGTRPEYLLSYSPFAGNDQHLVNYYENEVPYYHLDKNQDTDKRVDVISSVCPCAGLSMLSNGYGDHNPNNKWMIDTAKYILNEKRPKVYFGENSPHFAAKLGKNIREELRQIALDAGYSMSVYRTKSLLHGISQVRERSFYFFWEGDRVPIFNYYSKDRLPIEDLILSAEGSNSMNELINKNVPSDNPYYKFILEEIHGGRTHAEHASQIEPTSARGVCAYAYIERAGYDYRQVGEWMAKRGLDKEVQKCQYRYDKLKAGGSIMRRGVIVPKDFIGAFVGHYPNVLTHPVEDRFISYREGLTIMGMPEDFILLDAKKNTNHICQSVPVGTAYDMAVEIRESLLGNREWLNSRYVLQNNCSRTIDGYKEESTLNEFFN